MIFVTSCYDYVQHMKMKSQLNFINAFSEVTYFNLGVKSTSLAVITHSKHNLSLNLIIITYCTFTLSVVAMMMVMVYKFNEGNTDGKVQ